MPPKATTPRPGTATTPRPSTARKATPSSRTGAKTTGAKASPTPKPANVPKRKLSFGKGSEVNQELFPENSPTAPENEVDTSVELEAPSTTIVRLFGEIAEKDADPAALFNLGWMYLHGVGGVPKDEEKAYSYLFAAGEKNHALAHYHMGLLQLGVDSTAVPLMKSAASPRRSASPRKSAGSPSPNKKASPKSAKKKTIKKYGGPEFGVQSLERATELGCALAALELGIFFSPSLEEERIAAEKALEAKEKADALVPTGKPNRSAPVSPRNRPPNKPLSRQASQTPAAPPPPPKPVDPLAKSSDNALKWLSKAKEMGCEMVDRRIRNVEQYLEAKKKETPTEQAQPAAVAKA